MNQKLRIIILAYLAFAFVSCSGGSSLPQCEHVQDDPPAKTDATRSW